VVEQEAERGQGGGEGEADGAAGGRVTAEPGRAHRPEAVVIPVHQALAPPVLQQHPVAEIAEDVELRGEGRAEGGGGDEAWDRQAPAWHLEFGARATLERGGPGKAAEPEGGEVGEDACGGVGGGNGVGVIVTVDRGKRRDRALVVVGEGAI